jgi:hypothetical protein
MLGASNLGKNEPQEAKMNPTEFKNGPFGPK